MSLSFSVSNSYVPESLGTSILADRVMLSLIIEYCLNKLVATSSIISCLNTGLMRPAAGCTNPSQLPNSGKIWQIARNLTNLNQPNFSLSLWLKSIHSPNFFANYFQFNNLQNINPIKHSDYHMYVHMLCLNFLSIRLDEFNLLGLKYEHSAFCWFSCMECISIHDLAYVIYVIREHGMLNEACNCATY